MVAMIWKPTLATANFISAILVLWMQLRKDGNERNAINLGDGRVEFRRDPLAYLAWPLIVLLPAWAAINDYEQHAAGRPWNQLSLALILFAAIAELFRFPGTIVIAHDGVEQHFWLRGEKRIRWGEITEINRVGASGALAITASDGTKISYSNQLADRSRFLTEVEAHAHGKLPPEGLPGNVLGLEGKRRSDWR